MKNFGRALHPTTWWALGVISATFATLCTNPYLLVASCLISVAAMFAFRDSTLRSRSIAFYLVLAAGVVAIRLLFRIWFNQPDVTGDTALNFPEIFVNLGAWHFTFLGAISWLTLTSAFTDGLRLAAIILAIAMANTIANPRKLLRSTPNALYEISTAAAVAINLAPQLIESLHRVRRSRSLRAEVKGFKAFSGLLIPVLEDSLERSLSLAASMNARGFGLQGTMTAKQKSMSKLLAFCGVLLLGFSAFALLAETSMLPLEFLGLAASIALIGFALKSSAKFSVRTYYRPAPIKPLDLAIIFTYLTICAAFYFWAGRL
jgi:energy-coupling factor transport system permease protein